MRFLCIPLALVAFMAAPVQQDAPCEADIFPASFVADLAGRYQGKKLTAAVYHIETGCTYHLNEGSVVTTASVHKIEILAGVAIEAQNEHRSISQWERVRAAPMIQRSANSQASQLRRSIGGTARMRQLDELFGMADTVASDPWGGTKTTASDQVKLLRATLLNERGLLTEANVDNMWELMTTVTGSQNWGVNAGVPWNWTVALKNGFYPLGSSAWRVNSSGVARSSDGQGYAITILTYGWASMSPGIEAVERISSHVAGVLTPGDAACQLPTIEGTAEDDVLFGTDGPDVIHGRGGDDTIIAGPGDDVVCGGGGNDEIWGNEGDDVVRGGQGRDTLNGGKGRDVAYGGAGLDQLLGHTGVDALLGGRGSDTINGHAADDRLEGGSGRDELNGGTGDDLLNGGSGKDACRDPGWYESWNVWSGCESR